MSARHANSIFGTIRHRRMTAHSACAIVFVAMLASAAVAQEQPAQATEPGFFERIGKWFGRQADTIGDTFQDAGKGMKNFGQEASTAAKSTVEGAKDAAGAVVRIPSARMVTGHEKCLVAPNGAPDCVAAAAAMCKTKGFEGGKSLDMTTAENCPPQVLLTGRTSGAECKTETFVSRALCQ